MNDQPFEPMHPSQGPLHELIAAGDNLEVHAAMRDRSASVTYALRARTAVTEILTQHELGLISTAKLNESVSAIHLRIVTQAMTWLQRDLPLHQNPFADILINFAEAERRPPMMEVIEPYDGHEGGTFDMSELIYRAERGIADVLAEPFECLASSTMADYDALGFVTLQQHPSAVVRGVLKNAIDREQRYIARRPDIALHFRPAAKECERRLQVTSAFATDGKPSSFSEHARIPQPLASYVAAASATLTERLSMTSADSVQKASLRLHLFDLDQLLQRLARGEDKNAPTFVAQMANDARTTINFSDLLGRNHRPFDRHFG